MLPLEEDEQWERGEKEEDDDDDDGDDEDEDEDEGEGEDGIGDEKPSELGVGWINLSNGNGSYGIRS